MAKKVLITGGGTGIGARCRLAWFSVDRKGMSFL